MINALRICTIEEGRPVILMEVRINEWEKLYKIFNRILFEKNIQFISKKQLLNLIEKKTDKFTDDYAIEFLHSENF